MFLTLAGGCLGSQSKSVSISAGMFTPLYGTSSEVTALEISAFRIDSLPVTNDEFAGFLEKRSEWRRGSVAPLFADANYLKHWETSSFAGKQYTEQNHAPVTNVSWFAASAFCEGRGGKLPNVLQWEYVAAASHSARDASRDPEFVQQLLTWYGQPYSGRLLQTVGQGKPNVWGVYDMHGLIWEWVEDFNTVFVGGDNRRDGEQSKDLFCGDSAASSSDRANYAAFMRYALRSSLRGNYSMENLGFRCVYDA